MEFWFAAVHKASPTDFARQIFAQSLGEKVISDKPLFLCGLSEKNPCLRATVFNLAPQAPFAYYSSWLALLITKTSTPATSKI
jgi:hypothetical protein